MIATGFNEENCVLGKPEGMTNDECECLSVWHGPLENGIPCFISCWKVTADELAEINRTGRIWVMVMGLAMPPIVPVGVSPFGQQPYSQQ